MSDLERWLTATTGVDAAILHRLFLSVLIVVGAALARRVVLVLVNRRNDDPGVQYQWRKLSVYVTTALVVLLLARLWLFRVGSLSTFLGLVSAGLAIALRDPVVNLAGWIFILVRRPLEVGDRIEIASIRGDVIDLRIFQFTLLEIGNWVDADQSTGRVIHVPNGHVFQYPLANYTKGFQYIWNEVPVLVTFESDWSAAKTILAGIVQQQAEHLSEAAQQTVRQAARRFMIRYDRLTPTVYTSVRDSGVLLTMRYLCDPRQRRSSEEAIWEAVLAAFAAQPDIELAYPTTRFFDRRAEATESPSEAGVSREGGGEPVAAPGGTG